MSAPIPVLERTEFELRAQRDELLVVLQHDAPHPAVAAIWAPVPVFRVEPGSQLARDLGMGGSDHVAFYRLGVCLRRDQLGLLEPPNRYRLEGGQKDVAALGALRVREFLEDEAAWPGTPLAADALTEALRGEYEHGTETIQIAGETFIERSHRASGQGTDDSERIGVWRLVGPSEIAVLTGHESRQQHIDGVGDDSWSASLSEQRLWQVQVRRGRISAIRRRMTRVPSMVSYDTIEFRRQ